MNVAILNCNQIKPEFEQVYGQYPKMFKSLFNKIDQEIIFSEFDVMHGEYPQDLNSIDFSLSQEAEPMLMLTYLGLMISKHLSINLMQRKRTSSEFVLVTR